MRDIKFRGLSEKGKWHYGWYCVNDFDEPTIFSVDGAWKVLIESVGQFTGLKDKNSKKIYEGDLLREWIVEEHPSDLIYKVGFDMGHFTLTDIKSGYDRMGIWNVYNNLEVIGNIYENPQLGNNQ